MADTDREREPGDEQTAEKPGRNWRQMLLQKKWIALAAGAVLTAFAIIFAALGSAGEASTAGAEITLGEFEFSAGDVTGIVIQSASFRLHVSLLRQAEQSGRDLLAARQFKVQQEIEQLLRRAKSADFEDPLLADLKRQLQEMINETLGARVVEEIIITDLSLERAEANAAATFESAATSAPADSAAASPSGQIDLIY